MNTSAKPEVTQASVLNDMVHNEGITDRRVVASGSHGSGGDGPIPVLVKLLRPIPHLSSEEPEAIMQLFIRLDEVHSLGLVEDRVFITRILSLISGSLLTFWGTACGRGAVGSTVNHSC
jgi:hypothetical protein